MEINNIKIDDNYFTDAIISRFKGKEADFLQYLQNLLHIAIEELMEDVNLVEDHQIVRGKIIKKFEKHLRNIGFISKKSQKYDVKTNIGQLYKAVSKTQKFENIDQNGSIVKLEHIELYKKFHSKEKELYNPFIELIKNRIQKDLEISFTKNSATKQYSGKWVNPDILFHTIIENKTIYFSYEIKRWSDMDPIAPHEARNHARVISNYPNVAIHIPKDLMEFVIEYNTNFQIIKEDCKERGIGLFVFDPQKDYIFKLFDAEYFVPDPIKKEKYLKDIGSNQT